MTSRRVTIKDIAAEVGVSYRTVSLALNGKEGISDKMREKVLASAARLNYRPNILARGLVQGRSYLLGFACPHIHYSFFSCILTGIEEKCTEKHYDVILGNTISDDLDKERDTIQRMVDRNIDGLIIIPDPRGYAIYSSLQEKKFPMVQVITQIPGLDVPSVLVNNEKGGYMAAKHLTGLGHVHIGFLGSPNRYYEEIQLRYSGYTKALLETGVSLNLDNLTELCPNLLDMKQAEDATLRLLRRNRKITAVFAPTDHAAAGVITGCHKLGLAVPEDISVVGFDNMEFTEFMIPHPLTTLAQPKTEMGHLAFSMLESCIEGRTPESYLYEPELIVRDTTREIS